MYTQRSVISDLTLTPLHSSWFDMCNREPVLQSISSPRSCPIYLKKNFMNSVVNLPSGETISSLIWLSSLVVLGGADLTVRFAEFEASTSNWPCRCKTIGGVFWPLSTDIIEAAQNLGQFLFTRMDRIQKYRFLCSDGYCMEIQLCGRSLYSNII